MILSDINLEFVMLGVGMVLKSFYCQWKFIFLSYKCYNWNPLLLQFGFQCGKGKSNGTFQKSATMLYGWKETRCGFIFLKKKLSMAMVLFEDNYFSYYQLCCQEMLRLSLAGNFPSEFRTGANRCSNINSRWQCYV